MNLSKTEAGAQMPNQSTSNRFSFGSAYAKFSLLLLAITFVSVLPHYNALITESRSVPPLLIIHGILFLGWYILFAIQASLISSGRVVLHRKLGYWSVLLTVILAISGTSMLIGTMSSYDPTWNPQQLMSRTSFVWAIFHTLISFIVFYNLGYFYKASAEPHKRFMLLAALSMMSASITRFAYLPFIPVEGTAFTLLLTYALLIAPLVIDKVQRKRIHPVLKWGVPVYAITQILCIGLIPTTELGRVLAFPFS